MKLYRNWIINEVATAMTKGEHTSARTYVRTYIRTGQTLYPLHNFVVRGDNYGPLHVSCWRHLMKKEEVNFNWMVFWTLTDSPTKMATLRSARTTEPLAPSVIVTIRIKQETVTKKRLGFGPEGDHRTDFQPHNPV